MRARTNELAKSQFKWPEPRRSNSPPQKRTKPKPICVRRSDADNRANCDQCAHPKRFDHRPFGSYLHLYPYVGYGGHNQRTILLDFDNTATEHHSGGVLYDHEIPMGRENQEAFKRVASEWIHSGHNVAIMTRGIDTKISLYFTTILNMLHVMNDYRPGYISVYAPDEETFYREDQDTLWWANRKVSFVASYLDAANVSPGDAIFVDDTETNVRTMKHVYPSMKCLHASAGEYAQTFSVLRFII